uniref:Uncharacterized protein n=1 Tax=Anopheles farauti TaxID=69004 RepID=A0A182QH06_9DIPT
MEQSFGYVSLSGQSAVGELLNPIDIPGRCDWCFPFQLFRCVLDRCFMLLDRFRLEFGCICCTLRLLLPVDIVLDPLMVPLSGFVDAFRSRFGWLRPVNRARWFHPQWSLFRRVKTARTEQERFPVHQPLESVFQPDALPVHEMGTGLGERTLGERSHQHQHAHDPSISEQRRPALINEQELIVVIAAGVLLVQIAQILQLERFPVAAPQQRHDPVEERESIDGGEHGDGECSGQREKDFRRAKDADSRRGFLAAVASAGDIVDIFKFAPAHDRLGAFCRQHSV